MSSTPSPRRTPKLNGDTATGAPAEVQGPDLLSVHGQHLRGSRTSNVDGRGVVKQLLLDARGGICLPAPRAAPPSTAARVDTSFETRTTSDLDGLGLDLVHLWPSANGPAPLPAHRDAPGAR